MMDEVRIVDFDAYEPTNEEIVSWYGMMTAPDQLLWAITSRCVVGMIGINCSQDEHRKHCGEIGFGVAEAFTRQGVGSRLLNAAIQKARLLNLKRLEADCFDDNAASIALLRKFGFEEEGVRFCAIYKDGKLRNQKLFGLLL